MFEKEAEEYTVENVCSSCYFEKPCENKCEAFGCADSKTYVLKAFKDGAEFGYNKANEWHYVKDELPPENVLLNIITFDKNKKRRLWEGEYKGGNGQYWTGYFNHYIDVPYAWKEIVLPELKENE